MEPLILGLGGSLNETSLTGRILSAALAECASRGARTRLINGRDLNLPLYQPALKLRSVNARYLVESLREADGVILASPAYHGGLSGAVKNALDYAEDLRTDERPYLTDRTVACIVTAGGDQGAAAVLASMRTIIHALRGWPTPFGLAQTPGMGGLDEHGEPCDRLGGHIRTIADEVLRFSDLSSRTHRAAAGLD